MQNRGTRWPAISLNKFKSPGPGANQPRDGRQSGGGRRMGMLPNPVRLHRASLPEEASPSPLRDEGELSGMRFLPGPRGEAEADSKPPAQTLSSGPAGPHVPYSQERAQAVSSPSDSPFAQGYRGGFPAPCELLALCITRAFGDSRWHRVRRPFGSPRERFRTGTREIRAGLPLLQGTQHRNPHKRQEKQGSATGPWQRSGMRRASRTATSAR